MRHLEIKCRLKGQSLIFQFVLFFIIGFTIFVGVSQFFRYQSDVFKDEVTRENIKLINTFFSSMAVVSEASCKQCDTATLNFKTSNTTAGSFFEVSLGSYGINVSIPFIANAKYISAAHNLNASFELRGMVPSTKPISLTFNKTQNIIQVK